VAEFVFGTYNFSNSAIMVLAKSAKTLSIN